MKATEDTLLYMLSCDRLKELCRESKSFGDHFSATVKERLKAAVTTIQESDDPTVAAMMVSVGSLIRKEPITVDSGMTIRETAALMSNKNVSSVMVMRDDRAGRPGHRPRPAQALCRDRPDRQRTHRPDHDPGTQESSLPAR